MALREAEAPLLLFAMDAKEERRLLQAPVWTGAWRSALFAGHGMIDDGHGDFFEDLLFQKLQLKSK